MREFGRWWTVLALFAAAPAAAQVRQLGPHVHGLADLGIAVDGNTVEIELQSAATDIIGFESPPATPDQQAAVVHAQQVMANPLALFLVPKEAGCTTLSADAHQVLLDNPASPAGANLAQGTLGGYVAQASHSNFVADYQLSCTRPGAIATIGFAFFDVFPSTQLIHVTVLSDRGQFAFDVSRPQKSLNVVGAF
jgi:hypothetical protein